MQSKSSEETSSMIYNLLTSSAPQEFLLQQYSELLQTQNIELQYCKMYLYHLELKKKMQKEVQELSLIDQKIRDCLLETTPKKVYKEVRQIIQEQNSQSNQNTQKQKRMRRTANQISRHFVCQIQNCKKQYGSEGSLNQHMKLKHDISNKNSQGNANESYHYQKRDSKDHFN